MRQIPLTQGKCALVDDRDFAALSKHRWCYTNGYATRRSSDAQDGKKHEYMHIRLMRRAKATGLARGEKECVLHLDGNKLNNQRSNLIKTSTRNRQQRMQPRGASGYKGVQKRKGKWTAHIGVEGKTLHLGHFKEKDDAARAYNEAAKKYYPGTATLNKIEEISLHHSPLVGCTRTSPAKNTPCKNLHLNCVLQTLGNIQATARNQGHAEIRRLAANLELLIELPEFIDFYSCDEVATKKI